MNWLHLIYLFVKGYISSFLCPEEPLMPPERTLVSAMLVENSDEQYIYDQKLAESITTTVCSIIPRKFEFQQLPIKAILKELQDKHNVHKKPYLLLIDNFGHEHMIHLHTEEYFVWAPSSSLIDLNVCAEKESSETK